MNPLIGKLVRCDLDFVGRVICTFSGWALVRMRIREDGAFGYLSKWSRIERLEVLE
jgi:hypothetical protein